MSLRHLSVTWLPRLLILTAIITAWQLFGDDSADIGMPTALRTWTSFLDLMRSGELDAALLDSNTALLLGYALAVSVAVPLGITMGLLPTLRALINPYFVILLATPLIAFLPLLQTVFGLGLLTRVIVVFIFSFVYITINTEVGVRSVPDDLLEMARSFGATRAQRLIRVILPQAFPAIMAGARLGIGRAVVGMVIAELFLVSSGLGSLLHTYMARFDSGAVLALALTMVLEAMLVTAIARNLEKAVAHAW